MFKNPFKYQDGGAVQAREQVVNAISEIAQIPVEEVNLKLDQISQSQESIQLLSEALQAAQKGDERGFQVIKEMFNPQTTERAAFAKGGKIQDFICKHAKGGNVKECGCGGKTKKYQNPAGPIGRRQALDAAKENYGFNDSQARLAYMNAKNTLRNQGLRGSELRQQARQMLMNQREQIPTSVREQTRSLVEAPSLPQSYQSFEAGLSGGSLEQQQANNYRQIRDYSGNNFDSAFAQARRAFLDNRGANMFRWNGNVYNTNLGSGSSEQVSPTVDRALSGAVSHFSTIAPSTAGAVSYDGYRNFGENLRAFWRDLTGKKEQGGIIKDQEPAGPIPINRKAGKIVEYNNPFINNLIGQRFLNLSNISTPDRILVSAPTPKEKIANALRNATALSREEGLNRLESIGIPRFIGQDFGKTRRFLEVYGLSNKNK